MSPMVPGGVGVAAVVLLVVLVIGIGAGRSKRRWSLLLLGLVVAAGVGVVTTAVTGGPGERADEIARLYTWLVPPVVAFLAGWLCARGSWFLRIVVIAAAALLLAAFPYAAAGRATDQLLPVSAASATR
jgi:hypothetical protein